MVTDANAKQACPRENEPLEKGRGGGGGRVRGETRPMGLAFEVRQYERSKVVTTCPFMGAGCCALRSCHFFTSNA